VHPIKTRPPRPKPFPYTTLFRSSAASITKAFLEGMGIKQPSRKFELPDEKLGKCMQAYYGGRSEIRIRHQEVPVVVCDTTSEYPSVAGLLGLWPLLTAAN